MYQELQPEGGGHRVLHPQIIIRRNAALGDVLSSTVIIQRLVELGYSVTFQTHPHCQGLLRYVPGIDQITGPNGFAHINLDGAYETHAYRRALHFNEMWFESAQRQLSPLGVDLGKPRNARPRLFLSEQERDIAHARFADVERPIILICPASQYYNVRSVPDRIWSAAAKEFPGTTYWIGLTPAPGGVKDLSVRTIPMLVSVLAAADLLVTVDTGPMHIAAALGTKVLAIGQSSDPALHLTDQNDWQGIYPKLECLNCQQNICPKDRYMPPCQEIDPIIISNTVQLMTRPTVSAVIPIYRPNAEMLSVCLAALSTQVDEIVVTMESGGIWPEGVVYDFITRMKTRTVRHPGIGIGFGRNVNFGFRHTYGDFVLVLNDDVFLESDAVARMKEVMGPKVAVVGQFLKYPDGRIYHAGKPRAPGGAIGFPHIDHLKYLPSIKEPCQMENTNGASILVRRKSFYDIGGFDERFLFYAEDDDLAMRMRKNGWQIWYQPHAKGIHKEHQETKDLPGINAIMNESNRLFGQLWAPYFSWNKNNSGLGDFGYLNT